MAYGTSVLWYGVVTQGQRICVRVDAVHQIHDGAWVLLRQCVQSRNNGAGHGPNGTAVFHHDSEGVVRTETAVRVIVTKGAPHRGIDLLNLGRQSEMRID